MQIRGLNFTTSLSLFSPLKIKLVNYAPLQDLMGFEAFFSLEAKVIDQSFLN